MSEFDDDLPGWFDEDADANLSLDGGDDDDEEEEEEEEDYEDEGDDEEDEEEEDDEDEGDDEEDEEEEDDEDEGDDEEDEEEEDDEDEGDDEEDEEEEDDEDEGDDEEDEEEEDDEDEGDDEEDEEEEDDEDEGDDEEDEEEEDDEDEGDDEEDEEEEDDEDEGDDEEDEEEEDDEDEGDDEDDDEPVEIDDDEIYVSADDFPNAEEEDFEEDEGDWTDEDYYEVAEHLFGDNEYFDESYEERWLELGWELLDEDEQEELYSVVADQAPTVQQSVTFFRDGDSIRGVGFAPYQIFLLLQELLPQVDWSDLNVTVPEHPDDHRRKRVTPKPLPPKIANVDPADAVDLRKYASPIGDQGQTMRCSAFAWTHANELLHNMLGLEAPPLACSHAMLQFQQFQGDAKDFKYAFSGGEGTIGGPDPGKVLTEQGVAPEKLWPNDAASPKADIDELARQAKKYRLPAEVHPIDLKDLRKVLTAGYPVHIGMNTGEAFQKLGRDGVLDAAEQPSGDHGRHAMLVVGYLGNYFIIKNSWGTSWGDQGYAYIPKKVLADAEADLVAIIPKKAGKKKGKKGKK